MASVEQKLACSLDDLIAQEGRAGRVADSRFRRAGGLSRGPRRRGQSLRSDGTVPPPQSSARPRGLERDFRRSTGSGRLASLAGARAGARGSRRAIGGRIASLRAIDKRAAIARLRAALATAESLAEARQRERRERQQRRHELRLLAAGPVAARATSSLARRRLLGASALIGSRLGRSSPRNLNTVAAERLRRPRLRGAQTNGSGLDSSMMADIVPSSSASAAHQQTIPLGAAAALNGRVARPGAATTVTPRRSPTISEELTGNTILHNSIVDSIKIITEFARVPDPLLAQQQSANAELHDNQSRKVVGLSTQSGGSGMRKPLSLSDRFS